MNAISNGSRLNLLPMNVLSRDIGRWIDESAIESAIEAAMNSDVVKVAIPNAPESQAKKIEIQAS